MNDPVFGEDFHLARLQPEFARLCAIIGPVMGYWPVGIIPSGGSRDTTFFQVDLDLFDWLNGQSWHYSHGYARTWTMDKGYGWRGAMHDLVMNQPSAMPDHINRDRSDNRRANLRPSTRSQNGYNKLTNGKHGRGITFCKGRCGLSKPWRAKIGKDKTTLHIGYFATLDEARKASSAALLRISEGFADV